MIDYILAGALLIAALLFNVWAEHADKRDGYR